MCFSAQADLVAGTVVAAVGTGALRQVRHPSERALATLPVLLGAHLLVEAVVWWGVTGRVAASTGRLAMWAYLGFALCVLPVYVPLTVRAVEADVGRRRALSFLAAAGAVLAAIYLGAMVRGPVDVRIEGHHLAYGLDLAHGGLAAAVYAAIGCGAPILSGSRRLQGFGVANLVAVAALTWLQSSTLTSLWCAWAAVTSVAIVVHLRQDHPAQGVQVGMA